MRTRAVVARPVRITGTVDQVQARVAELRRSGALVGPPPAMMQARRGVVVDALIVDRPAPHPRWGRIAAVAAGLLILLALVVWLVAKLLAVIVAAGGVLLFAGLLAGLVAASAGRRGGDTKTINIRM